MQAVDVYNVCFPKDLVARETPRADPMDIVQAESTSCATQPFLGAGPSRHDPNVRPVPRVVLTKER